MVGISTRVRIVRSAKRKDGGPSNRRRSRNNAGLNSPPCLLALRRSVSTCGCRLSGATREQIDVLNVLFIGPKATVLLAVSLLAVLLAYVGWWDRFFGWFGALDIHLNLGAYFWFATLMFGL